MTEEKNTILPSLLRWRTILLVSLTISLVIITFLTFQYNSRHSIQWSVGQQDRNVQLEGFYALETVPTTQKMYRWTNGSSKIRLNDRGVGSWVVVVNLQNMFPDGSPVDAQLVFDQQTRISIPDNNEYRSIRTFVPSSVIKSRAIEFDLLSNTYSESEASKRNLGVILFGTQAFSTDSGIFIPPLLYLGMAIGIPLFIIILLRFIVLYTRYVLLGLVKLIIWIVRGIARKLVYSPSVLFDKYQHAPLVLLCGAFIFNTLLWNMIVQPGMPPDEFSHVDYTRYLLVKKEFPVYGVTRYLYDPNRYNAHASIPPLYYLLGTPFLWLARNLDSIEQIFVLRFWSMLLGTITVIFAYKTAQILVPQRPTFWLGTAILVGLNPMFTFISAAVNSDNLITTTYAILLYVLTYGLLDPKPPSKKWLTAVGVLLGIGLLTKPTILPAVIVVALVIIWLSWRNPEARWKSFLYYGSWIVGLSLLISGWWFVRNWQLYGDLTGTLIVGSRRDVYVARGYNATGTLWDMFFAPNAKRAPFVRTLTHSFWGVFDAMTDYMPKNIYYLMFFISIISLIGCCLIFVKLIKEKRNQSTSGHLATGFLFVTVISITLGVVIYASYYVDHQPQGRYLFPAIIPMMLFFIAGWQKVLKYIGLDKFSSIIFAVIVIVVNITALISTVAPSHHNRAVIQTFKSNETSKQTVYGPFQNTFSFIPHSKHIDSINILLNARSNEQQSVQWFIKSADESLIQVFPTIDLDSDLAVYALDTTNIEFSPNQSYSLITQQLTDDQNRAITLATSLISETSDILLPYIDSKNVIDRIYTFDRKYRSESIYNPRGLIQRYLFICVTILFIVSIIILLRYRFSMLMSTLITVVIVPISIFYLWKTPEYIHPMNKINLPYLSSEYIIKLYNDKLDFISNLESPIARKVPEDDDLQHISFIKPDYFTINDESRIVISMQSTSSITYRLELPDNPYLYTSLGINPAVWNKNTGDGVEFVIYINDGTKQTELIRQYVNPIANPSDRRWYDLTLNLQEYANQQVNLSFSVLPGPNANTNYDWAGWAKPQLINQP